MVRSIRARHPGFLLLAVGRLVYYKGFEYLIKAMRCVNATLLLVGDGPLRRVLERVAEDSGVSGRVHFLGNVNDIAPYYSACDVFILPSIASSEAFGIVQIEAMANGLPVINTNLHTGVPYVSVNNVTGLTVPPRDADSLAAAIRLLLDRADLRAQFWQSARLRVSDEFTVAKMKERTIDLYNDVLGLAKNRAHTVSR